MFASTYLLHQFMPHHKLFRGICNLDVIVAFVLVSYKSVFLVLNFRSIGHLEYQLTIMTFRGYFYNIIPRIHFMLENSQDLNGFQESLW